MCSVPRGRIGVVAGGFEVVVAGGFEVGEVHGQEGIVLPHRGAEEKGALLVEVENEVGEETGSLVINTLFADAERLNVVP